MTDMESQRIFIMGMPRSGTTVVGELLEEHPKILYYHEDSKNYPTSREINRKLKEGYWVVQKMPQQCLELKSLLNRFPKASFILLIKNDVEGLVRGYKKYPYPENLVVEGIYDPQKIWNKYLQSILPYFSHPRCFFLLLEELIQKKEEIITRIFAFLGLWLDSKVTEFAQKYISDKPVPEYPKGARSFQEEEDKTTDFLSDDPPKSFLGRQLTRFSIGNQRFTMVSSKLQLVLIVLTYLKVMGIISINIWEAITILFGLLLMIWLLGYVDDRLRLTFKEMVGYGRRFNPWWNPIDGYYAKVFRRFEKKIEGLRAQLNEYQKQIK